LTKKAVNWQTLLPPCFYHGIFKQFKPSIFARLLDLIFLRRFYSAFVLRSSKICFIELCLITGLGNFSFNTTCEYDAYIQNFLAAYYRAYAREICVLTYRVISFCKNVSLFFELSSSLTMALLCHRR